MLDNKKINIDEFREEIEIYKIKFPNDIVNLFAERALNKYRPIEPDKVKHNYPLLSKKYDADKIYNAFFKGEIALCNKDCFNDWIVNGYVSVTITPTLLGKMRKNGKKGIAIAQIRKFIETITENDKDIKDGYYNNVFGLKLNNTNAAKNIDIEIEEKLKLCLK